MKKIRTKITSFLLALAMIFGATGVSYAGIWNAKNLDVAEMLKAGLSVIEVTGPPALPPQTVPEETVPEPQKINMDAFSVTLGSYLSMATGGNVTPKILSVSGPSEMSSPVLKPGEYEVKYYRVYSFSEGIYEQVEAIREIGEYKIAVTAKDTETYEGEAYSLFSVIGKPQRLTIAKTRYALMAGEPAPLLQPKTDGDGTGFQFVSSDKTILTVSESGQTEILKPGRALVTVATEGTTLFQPAKLQVVFEIRPSKVLWDVKKMKAEKGKTSLFWKAQEGVTAYEVVYCTEKNFEKPKKKSEESAAKYAKRSADYVCKKKIVKAPAQKAVLKGLKADTTYHVRVRALTETTDTRGNKRTMEEGPWSSIRKISNNSA